VARVLKAPVAFGAYAWWFTYCTMVFTSTSRRTCVRNCCLRQKNYLSGEQKSFVEWLAKRAAGFRKVCLISTGDKGYRTVSLLLALYNSDRSNSFGPELSLNTGNCTTPSGLLIIKSHLAVYARAQILLFAFMQEAVSCWRHLPPVSS